MGYKFGQQVSLAFFSSDWDLELLWLVMGYKFGQQVSLAFFSSFLLFIGCEPKM
jgi:diphthamide biosynthesis methyltransferase